MICCLSPFLCVRSLKLIIVFLYCEDGNSMEEDSQELKVEAVVGTKSVEIYVEEFFEEIEKTVCIIYYVGKKGLYKHFVYIIPAGKTHVTVNNLLTGTYEVHAIQTSGDERIEGRARFDFNECSLDLMCYAEEILDGLERIEQSMESNSKKDRYY